MRPLGRFGRRQGKRTADGAPDTDAGVAGKLVDMRTFLHLIDGEMRPARSGRTLDVFDPARAHAYAQVLSLIHI